MARYLGPKAKLSRREGTDLFLKSARRSISDKAKFDSKPGQHGRTSGSRTSDFGLQLREKQKVKRMYGMWEKQFRLFFTKAAKQKGITGDALIAMLERRLDNVVCKSGLAPSRKAARQMIVHGHIYVNGRRVDRPAFSVAQGDRVAVKPADKSRKLAKAHMEMTGSRPLQSWLQVDAEKMEATVVALPSRDDIQIPVEEQLIVEMCSR